MELYINSAAADALVPMTPGHLQLQSWPQNVAKLYRLFEILGKFRKVLLCYGDASIR